MSTQGASDRLQGIAVALAVLSVLVLAFFAAPWYEQEGVAARNYVRREGPGGAPRPHPESPPPSDILVQDAVEDALAREPGLDAPDLLVAVEGGRVVLSGTAPSVAACERARALASATRGVLDVECRAEVPVHPQAASWVRDAFAAEPALRGLPVQVQVTGRRLVLAGTVPSLSHRRLVLEVAGQVRGIPRLQDRLEVAPAARPLAHARGEVERRLRGDALLEGDRVEVEMRESVAVLTGTVHTAAEKARAVAAASVPGVLRVEADGLQVRPSARNPSRPRTEIEMRRDVQEALRSDPRLDQEVLVEVADGVVTLRGAVRTLGASRAASRAADEVLGVRRVANRLRVGPVRIADPARVQASLARSPWVREGSVTATVREGVVRLDGTVDTVFHRIQAEGAAGAVEGVTSVVNRLEVRDPRPVPLDPFVGDPTPQDVEGMALPAAVPAVADRDLLGSVVDRLRWNGALADVPLQVEVDDGVVTLSGKVRGEAEARSAVASALRAGAVRVDDDLEF